MKVARSAMFLLVVVVLFCTPNSNKTATSSNTKADPVAKPEAPPQTGPGGPVAWAPSQESFVGTEGQAFLIAISVDCPSRTPTGHEVELLPPTPDFVHLTPENSRRLRALATWFALSAYGRDGHRDIAGPTVAVVAGHWISGNGCGACDSGA